MYWRRRTWSRASWPRARIGSTKPFSIFFSATRAEARPNICTAPPRFPSLNCSVAAFTRCRKRRATSSGSSGRETICRIAFTSPAGGRSAVSDATPFGTAQSGRALAEAAEHVLGARGDAGGAQAAEVSLELALAGRLGRRHREGLGDEAAPRRAGGRAPPAPSRRSRCSRIVRRRSSGVAAAGGGRLALGLREAAEDLHGTGADHLGFPEVGEPAAQPLPLGRGARLGQRLARPRAGRRGGSSPRPGSNSPMTLSLCKAWKRRSTRGRPSFRASWRRPRPRSRPPPPRPAP